MVVAVRLFIQVPEQVERFDAYVRAIDRPLEKGLKVL